MKADFHTGGRGKYTPTMTMRGLERLLAILGGDVKENKKVWVQKVMNQVMDGDRSQIEMVDGAVASKWPWPIQACIPKKRALSEDGGASENDDSKRCKNEKKEDQSDEEVEVFRPLYLSIVAKEMGH